MKKILLVAVAFSVLLTSCNLFGNFGKMVEINDKSEVYYKGEGVTEDDAKKLGKYFEEIGVFNNKEEKAVQISKEGDAYIVRLVIKEDVVKADQDRYETIFWYWQDMISENVFNGGKTTIILTDEKFKDLISLDEMNKVKAGKDYFVYYKGKGIQEKEAKDIAERFEQHLIFPYTNGSVLVTREKGELIVRFLPNTAQLEADKAAYYATLANLQYLIGKYVLENEDVKLVVIDAEFNDVKQFSELSSEEKTVLDLRMQGTTPENDPNQFTNNQVTPPVESDDVEGENY